MNKVCAWETHHKYDQEATTTTSVAGAPVSGRGVKNVRKQGMCAQRNSAAMHESLQGLAWVKRSQDRSCHVRNTPVVGSRQLRSRLRQRQSFLCALKLGKLSKISTPKLTIPGTMLNGLRASSCDESWRGSSVCADSARTTTVGANRATFSWDSMSAEICETYDGT